MKHEQKLAYLAGFIIGDGNLGDGYIIRAVEENKNFIKNVFSEMFIEVFGRKPKVYFDRYNNSYVAYLHCKNIWGFLAKDVGIETKTKSRTVKTPDMIVRGSDHVKAAFLSGIFDAEGSVILMKDPHHKNGYLRIQLKMCSSELVEEISLSLSGLGIRNSLYHYKEFSMIQINGKKQCRKFNEIIGFNHCSKNQKLMALL